MDDDQALFKAAMSGNLTKVSRLLNIGANPDARGSRGTTAVAIAAKWNHVDVLDLLLEAGADMYLEKWFSPLEVAAGEGNIEVLEYLLGREGQNGEQLRFKQSALTKAVASNQKEAVRVLISGGSDPNLRDEQGYMPISPAASMMNLEMLQFMQQFASEQVYHNARHLYDHCVKIESNRPKTNSRKRRTREENQ